MFIFYFVTHIPFGFYLDYTRYPKRKTNQNNGNDDEEFLYFSIFGIIVTSNANLPIEQISSYKRAGKSHEKMKCIQLNSSRHKQGVIEIIEKVRNNVAVFILTILYTKQRDYYMKILL